MHKCTWVCPGRELKSIIDYFLVRKDNRKRIKDVKVVRGDEIRSDHYLVLLKMSGRKRMERCKKVEQNVRIRTDRFEI